MPDLVGLPLNEALSKLNGAGLKVSKIASPAAPPSAPGAVPGVIAGSGSGNIVVAETPGRGHPVDANTMITLQVGQ
jgi:beta-lactam-binding protein with PASTA domain